VFLRAKMREWNTVAYSIVVEAWAAQQPKDWKIGDDPGPRPAQRPERKEVVIAIASDGTEVVSRTWEIVRDWHERVIGLEQIEHPDYGVMQGWMAELLNKSPNKESKR